MGVARIEPVLIDLPLPIQTPRLTIRSKQVGDGVITSAAVLETWERAASVDALGGETRPVCSRGDGDSRMLIKDRGFFTTAMSALAARYRVGNGNFSAAVGPKVSPSAASPVW